MVWLCLGLVLASCTMLNCNLVRCEPLLLPAMMHCVVSSLLGHRSIPVVNWEAFGPSPRVQLSS